MIGKLIGAFAGSKLAKSTSGGVDGPMGAVLGVAATTAIKRLSVPALLAITAGGYVMKKILDKPEAPQQPAPRAAKPPQDSIPV